MLFQLRNEGMAIFLTTHNMEEAAKMCDHVALLNEGVIVEYGTPNEICLKHNKVKKYTLQLSSGKTYTLEQTDENIKKISQWMANDVIETLHSCEPTLESVFLEMTGRELS